MTRGVRNLMLAAGGVALAMAALGAYALNRTPPGAPDVKIIAHGEKVDLERHAVPGKRSEEHTSELQSRSDLVCRLLLEKKNMTFCESGIWMIGTIVLMR